MMMMIQIPGKLIGAKHTAFILKYAQHWFKIKNLKKLISGWDFDFNSLPSHKHEWSVPDLPNKSLSRSFWSEGSSMQVSSNLQWHETTNSVQIKWAPGRKVHFSLDILERLTSFYVLWSRKY